MRNESVLVTGATGALGAHSWLRLLELGCKPKQFDLRATEFEGQDYFSHVLHLAGINRGTPEELGSGNLELAKQLTSNLEQLAQLPITLTFSNSVQTDFGDSDYAKGKRAASQHLQNWCKSKSVTYRDVKLPNLIGEFGRPNANMVSSTIVNSMVLNKQLPAMSNAEFEIASLQDAADEVCDFEQPAKKLATETVSAELLHQIASETFEHMQNGVDKCGTSMVESAIWRMLVAESFSPEAPLSRPESKYDSRGSFTELFKSSESDQQVSLIEFNPGSVRGNHFHRLLVEDFYAVSGSVEVEFGQSWKPRSSVSKAILREGDRIRFPVGWWHKFTESGGQKSQLIVRGQRRFNPESPDTIAWDSND